KSMTACFRGKSIACPVCVRGHGGHKAARFTAYPRDQRNGSQPGVKRPDYHSLYIGADKTPCWRRLFRCFGRKAARWMTVINRADPRSWMATSTDLALLKPDRSLTCSLMTGNCHGADDRSSRPKGYRHSRCS